MSRLFDQLKVGALELPNRIIMAPLTRKRAGVDRVPNALMAEYYRQRSGAGLILSEATSVSPQGVGDLGTPGIWNDHQVEGWRLVTNEVHEASGRIFLQLWHVGRISDPEPLDGQLPVAPSAIAAASHVSALRPKRPHPVPRALETEEIPGIVDDFRRGAERAKAAGFDGVELHAANATLLTSSFRTRPTRYGGSVENRARFLLEIVDALIDVWGAERVGVHLRPRGEEHDMGDSNPKAIFGHVADELAWRKIAFIFVREIEGSDSLMGEIKRRFGGVVIANELMSKEDGERLINTGVADALALGRDYIATPDLAERLKQGLPLNTPNKDTFYGEGPEGYTDYPRLVPVN